MLPGLKPTGYFGMASDFNKGSAKMAGLSHLHRFDGTAELRTQVRAGQFERDQRASAIRFVNPTDLGNFGPATVLRRGTNLKIQDVDTVQAQTDFSTTVQAFGLQHQLQAGADFSDERKTVHAARNAAQGGVNLVKPDTAAGTPNDGASIDESLRVLRESSGFKAFGWGAYLQDLEQIAPTWKLLDGLRYDTMDGTFNQYGIPNNAAGPVTTTTYEQSISEWSRRVGVLYQRNARQSLHLSYGTSFNTSGDAYSYNAQSANTPSEKSQNIEVGARLDSAEKRFTTRLAVFRSTTSPRWT